MYKVSGIYSITNKLNEKKFIAQSINIYERWKQHKRNFKNTSTPLYDDMREYGIENFEFKVIEKCPIYLLNDKEKQYIALYNTMIPNGYNRTQGGRGSAY